MRRRLLFAVFLLVIMAIAVAGHLYIWQRLVVDPQLPQPFRAMALVMMVILGTSWFVQPMATDRLPPARARWIAWPASLWMGGAWFVIVGLVLSDVLWWLVGTPTWATAGMATGEIELDRVRALFVLGLASVASAIGLVSAFQPPQLRRIEVVLARWPRALDGFRLVQISDLHIGPLLGRRFAAELVARCNALEPDLTAITGDLVDGSVRRLADDVAPFAELRARHGVYFITGNHDHYSGAARWVEHVHGLGIAVLRNERVAIRVGDATFDLAGVDDHNGAIVDGGSGEDVARALAGRDELRPVVLLAHDPMTFGTAVKHRVDLQISGHTHGGQIWPFRYFVRLATPYVAGLHRKNGSQIYVSRGTGFWGPCMRLFAPAEITELVLRSSAD
jgi:predicted MPP superfamily phosphohydrolase